MQKTKPHCFPCCGSFWGRTCMRSAAHMYPLPSKSKWSNAFLMFSRRKKTAWKEKQRWTQRTLRWWLRPLDHSLAHLSCLPLWTKSAFWSKAIWVQLFKYYDLSVWWYHTKECIFSDGRTWRGRAQETRVLWEEMQPQSIFFFLIPWAR